MESWGLDPLPPPRHPHFVSSPGMTMVALLKLTKEKVWSLTDPKQYLLIDKAKREDICFAGKSHVRDNNLYCESISFAKKKPETFLPYLDANNLYGHAMSQLLPVGGFKWASQTTLEASSQDGKPLRWRCQGHVPRSRSQLFKTSPQKSPRFPSHTKKKNAHCVQTSPSRPEATLLQTQNWEARSHFLWQEELCHTLT